MASHLSVRGIARPLTSQPAACLLQPRSSSSLLSQCRALQTQNATAARAFSTSPTHQKRLAQHEKRDVKIVTLLQALATTAPDRVRPPLRMARNRHLRHWTIHRAWLLFRRQRRERRERELMQQYQAMHNACEALRLTEGPGTRPEGYLYRVAMEKKGVYGHAGVPIEYARAQVETPAREPWNHDWKRV